MNTELSRYVDALAASAGKSVKSGEVFSKVLSKNDDSGRHGVLIPSNAYSFFPEFPILDPTQNVTQKFTVVESDTAARRTVAYKYYQRYPERRITRLPAILNATVSEPRLVIFSHLTHMDGTADYYVDCVTAARPDTFNEFYSLIFGVDTEPDHGLHIRRPIEGLTPSHDAPLAELLNLFDEIKACGWIDTMRDGDTGIGKTFEELVGVRENNDKKADFHGIELKCKRERKGSPDGKINLFQQVPKWSSKMSTKDRISALGKLDDKGCYSLYSQLTTTPNNLGLRLNVLSTDRRVNLETNEGVIGSWSFNTLKNRLLEKHLRTVFPTAACRTTSEGKEQFWFKELLYCDRPDIERFIKLMSQRDIVFEFTMRQKAPDTTPRNHGYPWRLTQAQYLQDLFAFQNQLRISKPSERPTRSRTTTQVRGFAMDAHHRLGSRGGGTGER